MKRSLPIRTLLLLVAFAVTATSCALPGRITGSREITAEFDDVGDLVSGHSVQVADVRIGSITDIELTEDFTAMVTMSIKDDVFIPVESRAILRTTSLLGEKFIELRALDPADPMAGTNISDGDHITRTGTAPELEFVTEQAVQLLSAVVLNDVATLVETGSVAFGGRGPELRSLLEDLSTVSSTLADQTDELVRIIDALDGATATLATSSSDIDSLLRNLADASVVLADNRDEAITAIEQVTRLAKVQNETVFEPHLETVNRQIAQLDAILAEVARDQAQIAELIGWVSRFSDRVPKGIPDDFAQIYGLVEFAEPQS